MAGRRWARDVLVAVAAGAALGSALFAVGSRVEADPLAWQWASSPSLAEDDLRDRVRGALLEVEVTACGVSRQGTVTVLDLGQGAEGLTNAHVVDGTDVVSMHGPFGSGPGTVLGTLSGRDAAVVDLGDAHGEAALLPGRRPDPGERVLVAGFPGGQYRAEMGTVRRVESRSTRGGTTPVLLVDVQAIPGVSGGVVADRSGRAVGLVAARDPSTGWAVAYPIGEVLADPRPGVADC